MSETNKVLLVDPEGDTLAELLIDNDEDGWFTGTVISQCFSIPVKKALEWYDEVVRDQMLSYLDEATAAVEQCGMRAHFPDGSTRKVFALHVEKAAEVSFRICPVPPPAWLPKVNVK